MRREKIEIDKKIKFVEPSKKVWFIEDVDHGKLAQVKQTKKAWDVNDGNKGATLYPYRD